MILGVFWCQRDALWVRFSEDSGMVHADVAKTSANPYVTLAWEKVDNGSWPVDYTQGTSEPLSAFYSFQEGKLYRTDGVINSLSKMVNASVRTIKGWNQHNPAKFNPFPDALRDEVKLSSYDNLPSTPEMLLEKWKQYTFENIHQLGIINDKSNQLEQDLICPLECEIWELDPQKYSCPEYLIELQDIINNSENFFHKKILGLAKQLDSIYGSLPNMRRTFILFDILRKEAKHLSDVFGLESQSVKVEKPTQQQPI